MSNIYCVQPYRGGPPDIDIILPGSKSITNRALLLGALSKGKTTLKNFLLSDDTHYMVEAFNRLGIKVEKVSGETSEVSYSIDGGKLPEGNFNIYVGNAGTAMRFLTSYLTLGRGQFFLDGDERMRERPIEDLLKALIQLGCQLKTEKGNGCPPVIINASGMPGGKCFISGKNSSQYISSILMTAPYSKKGVSMDVKDDMSSKPYIDMTIKMMEQFGVYTERKSYEFFSVKPAEYKTPSVYWIEPDASSASYFLAAVAILGGKIRVRGIGSASIQGDSHFARILEKMGCYVEYVEREIFLESDGRLKGINIDMNSIPDMVLTLSVCALFADGTTVIKNVANLRIKETDRLSALAKELGRIGAEVKEMRDGLEIYPGKEYKGALIKTYNDHRMAMSFSIAGLRVEGIEIENPGCVSKTFPDFYLYFGRSFNNSVNF